MRLNGIMALVAVVCVTGVVGGELLGPVTRLRLSIREDADLSKGRAILAGIAGDAFLFPGSGHPLAMSLGPITRAPRSRAARYTARRGLPRPFFASVSLLDDGGPGDFASPGAVQGVLEGLSPIGSGPSFAFWTEPIAFSVLPSLPAFVEGPGGGGRRRRRRGRRRRRRRRRWRGRRRRRRRRRRGRRRRRNTRRPFSDARGARTGELADVYTGIGWGRSGASPPVDMGGSIAELGARAPSKLKVGPSG